MINDLSIDQLRTFATIAEVGSYTRAAERLHRTQPALSLQIKRLEAHLGTPLFERKGRSVTATEAGQVLLVYAHRILDLNEEAFAKLTTLDTEGSVKVGVLEEIALGPLATLLTKFGRLCSKIKIELHVATSADLAARIRDNTLCLAIANRGYDPENTLLLWEEAYLWAAHPTVDVFEQDPLPLLLCPFEYSCPPREAALELLNRAGRRWEVVFSSVSMTAIQAAVRAGLGIGILGQSALPADVRVLGSVHGLPPLPSEQVALYRGSKATSEAVDCLVDFLIAHLKSSQPSGPMFPTPLSLKWPLLGPSHPLRQ